MDFYINEWYCPWKIHLKHHISKYRFECAPDHTLYCWGSSRSIRAGRDQYGCGIAHHVDLVTGSMLDGTAVRSCSLPISASMIKAITTWRWSEKMDFTLYKKLWIAENVPQCGYLPKWANHVGLACIGTNGNPSDAWTSNKQCPDNIGRVEPISELEDCHRTLLKNQCVSLKPNPSNGLKTV